jgi:hypothetical protein
MAELKFNADLKIASKTLEAIDAAVLANAEDGFRTHLGASLIGRPCGRSLWYAFRWARKASFDARTLRLFARGQREEDVMAGLLRSAGMNIMQVDASTGQQFRFSDCDGHFGGSMDGGVQGVPDAPKAWHVWECKTAGKKAFDDLAAKGVRESKPEHWAQMQCYMHWTGMERALYTTVCKDDDRLHIERVGYDKKAAEQFIALAHHIINAPEPLERIGSPDFYLCKWCDHHAICHGEEAPAVNCRTCAHSTPVKDAGWTCEGRGVNLTTSDQRKGCEHHRYIPILLEQWADVKQANHEENWVKYRHRATGWEFVNGAAPDGYTSAEIHACADKAALPVLAQADDMRELREKFNARVVG